MKKTKSQDKKPNISRRKFLADAGKNAVMLTAFDTIFGSLLHSANNVAFAQSATGPFKQFLHINMFAAPPRWMFDLILNPKNDPADFEPSPMVTNFYTGDSAGYTGANYRLVNYMNTGTYVPHLLGQMVPRPGTGSARAWTFMQNMITIRGIDVLNAAHDGANRLHQVAVPGTPTMSSLTADRAMPDPRNPSANLIRALNLNPNPGSIFQSSSGFSSMRYDVIRNVDNLSRLFTAMQPISTANGFTTAFVRNKGALESRLAEALTALAPGAARYYKSMVDNSDLSLRILSDSSVETFQQLSTEWNELYPRYQNLVNRVLGSTSYVGITDKPILNPTDRNPDFYSYSNGTRVQNEDLRTMIMNPATNTPVANLDQLAAQFAVLEFLMKKKICPSISFSPSQMQGLQVNGSTVNLPFDQHFTGRMPGIIGNSLYFLGFSACLIELISVLKANNLFNDTLIYMNSEFNRCARVGGSGSDHAAPAAHVNLLSGRINNFKLIGNIYRDSAGVGSSFATNYKGCWGHGAPIDGKRLTIVQVWGSVLRLLGMSTTDIPNLVNKSKLIFNTPGSFAIAPIYNQANNIRNASK